MIITIEWMIAMVCGAILAIWIAYESTLIQSIKKMLWLVPSEDKTRYRIWFRPIVFMWKKLQELLSCPYCIGFHIGWILNYFYFQQDILTSMLYGTIVVLFVELYRKLTL